MNQIDFITYLSNCGTPKKVTSDHVSRLKRLENSILNCDIDEEFEKDECNRLLSMLAKNKGTDELKKVLIAPLPIGSYAMNTFRYSIRKYIEFKKYKNCKN